MLQAVILYMGLRGVSSYFQMWSLKKKGRRSSIECTRDVRNTNESQRGVLALWSINLCKCQWLGEIGALTFRDGEGENV